MSTLAPAKPVRRPLDPESVRREFPILSQKVHGKKPLTYLDSAASAQKPLAVVDAIRRFSLEDYANIHRGVYELSERATRHFEGARDTVQRFIDAGDRREIVFTSGTTASVNLIAQTLGRRSVGEGDEILLTEMEHHSNIVPWQLLAEERGAKITVVPMNDRGELRLGEYELLLGARTRLVALTHQSNALGTINPVKEMIEMAHARGVPVIVDGAQAVPHHRVSVRDLDCDFYLFSGHKLYGPTGIGVLYGKKALLEEMPPWQGGGEMIRSVTFEKTTYNALPHKFEAGTPNIVGAVGLGAAIDWVEALGLDAIAAHESDLLSYGIEALAKIPALRFIGTAAQRASVLSFVLDDVHPHDIATILDQEGVAVRAGHHCAQPVMRHFDVPATVRASLAAYNTRYDIDALVAALHKVREVFA